MSGYFVYRQPFQYQNINIVHSVFVPVIVTVLTSVMYWGSELQIVFIYDTLSCRKEEDDPKEAILYFHPSDIAEERRIAICGQLMGITHFLIDSFSTPQILTLENGKFALRKFGKQYVLALGCSSITPDWLLEKQADILDSLTRFFHRDIQSILIESNGDRNLLSKKLTSMMDHYIPVSQHHGDLFALTFGILPILSLPKSASSISLQATLLLQTSMMKRGVLGGIVMYQNKVVGVELCQDLAQKLAFIQPYQLPPAEVVKVEFKVPPGVQLFTVYVSERELKHLRRRAVVFQHPASCESTMKPEGVNLSIDPIREEDPSDVSSSIGFSEVSSSIYLEDAASHKANSGISSCSSSVSVSECYTDPRIFSVAGSNNKDERDLEEERERNESGVVSMEGPMESNSKSGKMTREDDNSSVSERKQSQIHSSTTCSHLNSASTLTSHRRTRSLNNLNVCETQAKDNANKGENSAHSLKVETKSSSLTDPYFPYILCNGKCVSKHLIESAATINAADESEKLSNGCSSSDPQLFQDASPGVSPSPEPISVLVVSDSSKSANNSTMMTTVVDANANTSIAILNPPPSASPQSNNHDDNNTNTNTSTPSSFQRQRPVNLPLNQVSLQSKNKNRRWSTFDDMMSPIGDHPLSFQDTPVFNKKNHPDVLNKNDFAHSRITNNESEEDKLSDGITHLRMMNSFRKLSSHDEDMRSFQSSSENEKSYFNSVPPSASSISKSKKPSSKGLPSGPNSSIHAKVTKRDGNWKFNSTLNVLKDSSSKGADEEYDKSCLFIYSHGSMRLLLLLDLQQPLEIVQALWEHGSIGVLELETAIVNVEEQNLSMGACQSDPYCYLRYEPVWKSLAHGGRNHSMDFDIVQLMHRDFTSYPNMSELIIRGEDHVVYGYHCVGSEVYYQQSANLLSGLPMPSDLMGKVPQKAKRRLERDHNIILL